MLRLLFLMQNTSKLYFSAYFRQHSRASRVLPTPAAPHNNTAFLSSNALKTEFISSVLNLNSVSIGAAVFALL